VFVLNFLWIRSFGLMLGLINKPRLVTKEWKDGKSIEKHHITTILVVPHRDLAFQLYRIVDRIIKTLPKTRVESIAYVLVRGTGIPIPRQILRLETTPPHILICTPKALLDVYRRQSSVLKLFTLSTVAVDEVDYLVEVLPRKNPKKSFKQAHEKAEKKVARHPGLTRQFLDNIFSKRKEWNEERHSFEETGKKTPQLILMSATMHVPLKNYFYEDRGWLTKDNVVKIIKNDERKKSDKKKVKKAGASESEVTGEQGTVLHSILVVSEGETKNVVEARDAPELKWTKGEEETEAEAEAEVDEHYDESKQRRI
jgi:superfamily II DNA/RNA helicase